MCFPPLSTLARLSSKSQNQQSAKDNFVEVFLLSCFSHPSRTEVQEPSRLNSCFTPFEVSREKGTGRSCCRKLAHPFPRASSGLSFRPCPVWRICVHLLAPHILLWVWVFPRPHCCFSKPHPKQEVSSILFSPNSLSQHTHIS